MLVGVAETGKFEFSRPEQGMKVEDVLADEVVQLGLAVGLPPGVKSSPFRIFGF